MLKPRYKTINLEIDDLRKKDYLNNLIYSKTLEDYFKDYFDSKENKPIYISLTGGFGTGKNVVSKTAINELKKSYDLKELNYDCWKYGINNFRRSFANNILDQIIENKNTFKYRKYLGALSSGENIDTSLFKENNNKNKHEKRNNIIKKIALTIIFVSIIFLLFYAPKLVSAIFVSIAFIFINFRIFDLFKIINVFKSLNIFKANNTYINSQNFYPEKFYNMINKLLNEEVKEKYKIVLIDNLDKINVDEFNSAMTSINGLLDGEGKIVYLFLFDSYWFDNSYTWIEEQYLKTIFKYSIDMKENSNLKVKTFIDNIIKEKEEYKDLFTKEVIDLLLLIDNNRPKHILFMMNHFITEYNLFSLKNNKIDEKELVYLMKYTILKVNYKDLFKRSFEDVNIIKKLEGYASKNTSYEDVITDKDFQLWLFVEAYEFLLKANDVKPDDYNKYYI